MTKAEHSTPLSVPSSIHPFHCELGHFSFLSPLDYLPLIGIPGKRLGLVPLHLLDNGDELAVCVWGGGEGSHERRNHPLKGVGSEGAVWGMGMG